MSQTFALPVPVPVPGAGDALLEEVKPPPDARTLIIGHRTLDMLCGLIRRGCAAAIEVRPDEPGAPLIDKAQVAVIPDPASLAEATASVAIAKRALACGGHIAIYDVDGLYRRELTALLRQEGFVAISTRDTPDGALVVGRRSFAVVNI